MYVYTNIYVYLVTRLLCICHILLFVEQLPCIFSIYLYSAMVSTALFNAATAPTATGMVGSYQGLAVTLLQLCRTFNWFHVTLFKDSTASTDFYLQTFQATEILARTGSDHSQFFLEGYSFDPTSAKSMPHVLLMANQRSRGINPPYYPK